MKQENSIVLVGIPLAQPKFSFKIGETEYFEFNLKTKRKNTGKHDIVKCLVAASVLEKNDNIVQENQRVAVFGTLKILNSEKPRQTMRVFVTDMGLTDNDDENWCVLTGTLEKVQHCEDGFVVNFTVLSGKNIISCVAWNEHTLEVEVIPYGANVCIQGRLTNHVLHKSKKTHYDLAVSKIQVVQQAK